MIQKIMILSMGCCDETHFPGRFVIRQCSRVLDMSKKSDADYAKWVFPQNFISSENKL